MIRAKVAFAVSPSVSRAAQDAAEEGLDPRELFSEQQVAEDFEFGSRVQAAGFKSVFIDENLATGEVRPPQPRACIRPASACTLHPLASRPKTARRRAGLHACFATLSLALAYDASLCS